MARLSRLGAAPRRARARPRAPEHRGRGHRQQLEANAARASETTQAAEQRFERADEHRTEAERLERQAPTTSGSPTRRSPPPRSSRPAASAPGRRPRATTSAPPRPRTASSSCRAVAPAVHGRYRTRGHPSLRARLGPFACPRRHRRPADGPRRAHLPHRPCAWPTRWASSPRSAPRSSTPLLLKDAGCSTTAAQIATTLRQRRPAGQAREPADRRAPARARRSATCGATSPPARPLRAARPPSARRRGDEARRDRELERMRCERGADIARGIGLDEDAAAAIEQLFEHWDGNGHPASLRGRGDLAAGAHGVPGADDGGLLAAGRRGRRLRRRPRPARHLVRPRPWSTPSACSSATSRFWASLEAPDVQRVEPADRVLRADDARLDRVAEAFAGIVDAKSPYTAPPLRGRGRDRRRHRRHAGPRRRRPRGLCAARRCCTTSASSASPTASSTSPAR